MKGSFKSTAGSNPISASPLSSRTRNSSVAMSEYVSFFRVESERRPAGGATNDGLSDVEPSGLAGESLICSFSHDPL